MGSRAIDMILPLRGDQVKMKDVDHVEQVVSELIKAGKDKLQVIADFDMTLSAFSLKGQRCVTCHKALDDCPKLSDSYREKAYSLRNHFYPIEIDPSMSTESKIPLMVEWWTKSHDLMVDLKLRKEDIEHIVRDSTLALRDNCDVFFQKLHQEEIPLLVFSAGVGNIIEEVIKQQSRMFGNMHIVSNFMKFNKQGHMVGFQEELIHSFNKNESAVHKSDYFDNLKHRENIILMGDSLGDLHMANGAEHCKNILKIGFLNDNIEERLPAYLSGFDIVLISDETMNVGNGILNAICAS